MSLKCFYKPMTDPNPETISVPPKTKDSLPGKIETKIDKMEPQAAASAMPPINLKQYLSALKCSDCFQTKNSHY